MAQHMVDIIEPVLLIERVSPAIRKRLVALRITAMGGKLDSSIRGLKEVISVSNDRQYDVVAAANLWAELLHLDGDHKTSMQVMNEYVVPYLDSFSPAIRFGLEQNLSDVQLYLPTPSTDGFYNLVDQKRIIEFEWLDYGDLFSAEQNARAGKHRQVLPVLWRQHRKSYLHGCWLAQNWTNSLLGIECCKLKSWDEGIKHAVLAHDSQLLKEAANGVAASRDVTLASRVVNALLKSANLRTHFARACEIIETIADSIPDGDVDKVAKWLLPKAKEDVVRQLGPNHVKAAWQALGHIVHRLPNETARDVVLSAITHPIWLIEFAEPNRVMPERRELVQTLVTSVRILPVELVDEVAKAALPLATSRIQVSDYDDVINLLCNLAMRASSQTKEMLATALYPKGQGVSRALAQVSHLFDKQESFDVVRLETLAQRVAVDIRRQVQWLEVGQAPERVDETIMEYSSGKSGRTLKVYLVAFAGLHALARHRHKLNEESLCVLIQAMLDMSCHEDNFPINRQGLVECLAKFADVIPLAMRDSVEHKVLPMAQGDIAESTAYATSAEADNPLSVMRMQHGSPQDLQAAAIITLAALINQNAESTIDLGLTFEEAVCHASPEIRRAGYVAVSKSSKVSDGVLLGVLAGLRDPDMNAAVAAFEAMWNKSNSDLEVRYWRVLLMAIRFAQRTGDSRLRRYAAKTLVAFSAYCPEVLTSEWTRLSTLFAGDASWWVRSAIVAAVAADVSPTT
jgi:hypothetical protein